MKWWACRLWRPLQEAAGPALQQLLMLVKSMCAPDLEHSPYQQHWRLFPRTQSPCTQLTLQSTCASRLGALTKPSLTPPGYALHCRSSTSRQPDVCAWCTAAALGTAAPHQPRPCSPTIDAAWAGTGCGWSEHGRSALLQGQHPKHRDVSDPALLGTVERYFLEIMDIPRLQQRIDCFIFTRQFAPNVARVSSHLLRWCSMHWQATALQLCIAALNLHAQLSCGKGEHVRTASACGSGLWAPRTQSLDAARLQSKGWLLQCPQEPPGHAVITSQQICMSEGFSSTTMQEIWSISDFCYQCLSHLFTGCQLTVCAFRVPQVQGQLDTLRDACSELQGCDDFMTLLKAVLALGNHLNQGTHKGNATGATGTLFC